MANEICKASDCTESMQGSRSSRNKTSSEPYLRWSIWYGSLTHIFPWFPIFQLRLFVASLCLPLSAEVFCLVKDSGTAANVAPGVAAWKAWCHVQAQDMNNVVSPSVWSLYYSLFPPLLLALCCSLFCRYALHLCTHLFGFSLTNTCCVINYSPWLSIQVPYTQQSDSTALCTQNFSIHYLHESKNSRFLASTLSKWSLIFSQLM